MNFSDTAKAPVVITVAGEQVAVPKFLRSDWKAWAAEMDAQRLDKATAGMSPEERFKFVAFFGIPPTSADELRTAAVATPDGQDRVITTCLKRLGWDAGKVGDFLDANDPQDVQLLAVQLASIRPRVPTPAATTSTPPEGENGSDPQQASGTDLATD